MPGQIVTGLSQSAAVAAITTAGLMVGQVAQEPGVQVPNVLGLTETAAIAALDAAGFGHNLIRVQDCGNPGRIVDQSPAGGTVQPSGTTVASPATPAP